MTPSTFSRYNIPDIEDLPKIRHAPRTFHQFIIANGKIGKYNAVIKKMVIADKEPTHTSAINGVEVLETDNKKLYDKLIDFGFIISRKKHEENMIRESATSERKKRISLEEATTDLSQFAEYFTDVDTGMDWICLKDNSCLLFNDNINMVISSYFESINEEVSTSMSMNLKYRMKDRARKNPHNLYARHCLKDGHIYYQLNKDKCVDITADGWDIININSINVRFRTHKSFGDQREPIQTDKNIFDFMDLFRCETTKYKILLGAALISGIIPDIDHPVVNIVGDQGSGKSTIADRIKATIDPLAGRKNITKKPETNSDLILTLYHNQCVIIDNISHINDSMSNLLSAAVTGAGLMKRALYTNSDVINIPVRPLVVLTGVNDNVRLSDLKSRTIEVNVKYNSEQHMHAEDLQAEFQEKIPELFGVLCNHASQYLKNKKNVKLLPDYRLTDFYIIATKISESIGVDQSVINGILDEERIEKIKSNIHMEVIGAYLVDKLVRQGGETMIMNPDKNITDINMTILNNMLRRDGHHNYRSPNSLSGKFNTIKKDLEEIGIFKVDTDIASKRFNIEYRPHDAAINIKPADILDEMDLDDFFDDNEMWDD